MKTGSQFWLALGVLIGVPVVALGDVVYLNSGGKMEGRIVSQTETSIEVDIGAGTLTFPMSSVDRIEKGRSPLDDYDERAAALGANDSDGWLELARWASSQALGTQSRRAYERVRGNLGVTRGEVVHLFHGTREKRNYGGRTKILVDNDYDPESDIRVGDNGLLEWATEKPGLHRAVADYFAAREEDEES